MTRQTTESNESCMRCGNTVIYNMTLAQIMKVYGWEGIAPNVKLALTLSPVVQQQ